MDISVIFELAKNLTGGFDLVIEQQMDYLKIRTSVWKGRIWADFTKKQALSKQCGNSSSIPIPILPNSIEELLLLCFSKFRNQEFQHGLFLIKADFGHDWFTPVLLHPHAILRIPRSTPKPNSLRYLDPNESYVLMYLGPSIREFCTIFYPVGLISGINTWSAVIVPEMNPFTNVKTSLAIGSNTPNAFYDASEFSKKTPSDLFKGGSSTFGAVSTTAPESLFTDYSQSLGQPETEKKQEPFVASNDGLPKKGKPRTQSGQVKKKVEKKSRKKSITSTTDHTPMIDTKSKNWHTDSASTVTGEVHDFINSKTTEMGNKIMLQGNASNLPFGSFASGGGWITKRQSPETTQNVPLKNEVSITFGSNDFKSQEDTLPRPQSFESFSALFPSQDLEHNKWLLDTATTSHTPTIQELQMDALSPPNWNINDLSQQSFHSHEFGDLDTFSSVSETIPRRRFSESGSCRFDLPWLQETTNDMNQRQYLTPTVSQNAPISSLTIHNLNDPQNQFQSHSRVSTSCHSPLRKSQSHFNTPLSTQSFPMMLPDNQLNQMNQQYQQVGGIMTDFSFPFPSKHT